MEVSKIKYFVLGTLLISFLLFPTNVFANLTKEQAEDVALFATTFIEKGNERRDENGYPLLVYALSNNWKTCIEIRRSGYESKLYHVKNNAYHMKNGKYLDLGLKWCMDCGDFISYVYKTTLGLDLFLEETEDPWHIKDMYADANKGENSEYFYFVYKNVPISSISEEKLEKGDIVLRLGSRENHGLIYVGENMQTAHASRNAIKYKNTPPILGFEVVTLNKFYKSSTIVSIARVKDGVVPENQNVNSTITWPDTGEVETLLPSRDVEMIALDTLSEENNEEELLRFALNDLDMNLLAKEHTEVETSIKEQFYSNKVISGENEEKIIEKLNNLTEDNQDLKNQIWSWLLLELKRILMGIRV